jgi:GNAT superfamily N-acetyltransferase
VTDLVLRPLGVPDQRVLRAMLYEAACWRPSGPRPPVDEILGRPELRVYHAGWGRPGDRGIVAEVEGHPVGATWSRIFTADDHGYGFVDETTPELTLAVAQSHRRLGIGRALLSALLAQARLDGAPAISLSVEHDNPARRLYEVSGFTPISEAGGAATMRLDLRTSAG